VSTFIDRRRVLAAEQQLASAHATHDLRRIATLLHDDYRILQPNGTVETKADVLASYADGHAARPGRAGGRYLAGVREQ
jgi:hypothetical protein